MLRNYRSCTFFSKT